MKNYDIGNQVYLKQPYLGYSCVEIVDFEYERYVVELPSGKRITIDDDEIQ